MLNTECRHSVSTVYASRHPPYDAYTVDIDPVKYGQHLKVGEPQQKETNINCSFLPFRMAAEKFMLTVVYNGRTRHVKLQS